MPHTCVQGIIIYGLRKYSILFWLLWLWGRRGLLLIVSVIGCALLSNCSSVKCIDTTHRGTYIAVQFRAFLSSFLLMRRKLLQLSHEHHCAWLHRQHTTKIYCWPLAIVISLRNFRLQILHSQKWSKYRIKLFDPRGITLLHTFGRSHLPRGKRMLDCMYGTESKAKNHFRFKLSVWMSNEAMLIAQLALCSRTLHIVMIFLACS